MKVFRRIFGLSGDPSSDASLHRLGERVHGITDGGRVRANNEDYFLIHPKKGLLVVADGMGGHNAGEVASRVATEALNTYLSTHLILQIRGDETAIRKELLNAVEAANREVLRVAVEKDAYRGMGCTLVAALIDGNLLHLCHIGDARAYVADRETIRLLTTDHSVVMELVKEGQMSVSDARKSRMRNELTQAIGIVEAVEPDYRRCRLREGDRIILCSDGLWDMVSDDDIGAIAGRFRSAVDICEALVDAANEAGGKDNVTAVVGIHRTGV